MDRKIEVKRPTVADAPALFHLYLKNLPLANGDTHTSLAKFAAGELFHPRFTLYDVQRQVGGACVGVPFTLGHVASGALIANVVDQATSLALRRDMKSADAGGLLQKDLTAALTRVFTEQTGLSHTDDLTDFVRDFRSEVQTINKKHAVAA